MRKIISYLIVAIFLFGCEEDKSSDANITTYSASINGTSNILVHSVNIDEDNQIITVVVDADLSDVQFPLSFTTVIEISSGATITPGSGDLISFNSPDDVVLHTVKAEDGTEATWAVNLRHKQLPNSDFEDWHTVTGMNQMPYQEPGADENSTIWATANMGTSIYGVYGTVPHMIGSNTVAKIETGITGSVPITAGTIFTGIFNTGLAISNPTDPTKATMFGTPFIFKPTGVKVKYKYTPGEYYIQGTILDPGNIFGGFDVDTIPGTVDECKIYAFLEVHSGELVTEIARAEMTAGPTNGEMLHETTFEFEYTSTVDPTHFTIVFTSSKGGDFWRGAVGSTLLVDDLELLYE